MNVTAPVANLRAAQPFISCVVPAYNEGPHIARFLEALHAELLMHSQNLEIIVVNDGSRDDTVAQVMHVASYLPVKLIDFSRNFGKEAALTAGIDHAEGDVVILIDADFQHPVATISDFMLQWRAGYDMVYGVRNNRHYETGLRRDSARFFYWLLERLSSVDLPAEAGDFRLLDRSVVLALRQLPERNRFMKGLYSWVGFQSTGVPFDVQDRIGGESAFHFRQLWRLALTGLLSFSDIPLRMWTVIGLVVSGLSFVYAIYVVAKTMMYGADTEGWPTIVVAIMFFGGVQLISIGVLGEYVARIFNEVKQRPTYLVREKHGFNRTVQDEDSSAIR
jgi:glycosyltransferase involved in cell wall biosynthesis